MASRTYVVNQTLSHLGQPTEDSLDNVDTLRNATRKVLTHLDQARDAVLEKHNWLDAMEYVSLDPSEQVPANWKYDYGFQLPADAVRICDVDNTGVKWERGSRTDGNGATRRIIRANDAGPLDVSYIRRVAWEALPPALVDAIALECAARACHGVLGDERKAMGLRKEAAEAVLSAIGIDGMQEGGQGSTIDDDLAAIRDGAY